jgi:hypothetical protein
LHQRDRCDHRELSCAPLVFQVDLKMDGKTLDVMGDQNVDDPKMVDAVYRFYRSSSLP